jgi:hypothetical protein
MTTKATACRMCGRQTMTNIEVRYGRTPLGQRDGHNYEVGLCKSCETLRVNEVGAAVRACLRVLGKPEADWPALATVLMDMEIDATGALFETSPAFRHGPQKPFGHIDRATKARLRQAYAQLLADRVAVQPDPVPEPPEPEYPQGCLGCGIGLSSEGWQGPVLSPALTPGPEMTTGVVCLPCATALRDVGGAVGPTWLERAVMVSKGLAWTPHVKPWIATGLPPQDEPWGWMDVQEEPLTLDPITFLQMQVSDLQDELASLRSEVDALRSVPVP